MFLERWGATDDEVEGPLAGDGLVPDARMIATRSIDVAAPPADVFPWLVQMGFGRAGWYSYDWIDNLGRRSAERIHPEWQDLAEGDPVPAGPTSFLAAVVDEPEAFAIVTPPSERIGFSLAFECRPADGDQRTRLVSRARARIDVPGGTLVERFLLGPGDGLMVRKQLLTLAERAAHSASRE